MILATAVVLAVTVLIAVGVVLAVTVVLALGVILASRPYEQAPSGEVGDDERYAAP